METSALIVQSLVDEVNAMRVGHVIPFGWDVSIYTHPLCVVVPTVIAMSQKNVVNMTLFCTGKQWIGCSILQLGITRTG